MASLFKATAVLLGLVCQVQGVATPKHFGEDPSHKALFAAPPLGNVINRANWKVTCDSQESGYGCQKAIDGNNNTFWHTNYDQDPNPPPPHHITVDLGSAFNINGISALPRQDGNSHGFISRHEVAVSTDGNTWQTTAFGTWYTDDATLKVANFETVLARYVRLTAITEVYGNPWTSLAEINIFQSTTNPVPFQGTGRWGPTINFPTIPVAAMLDPTTGQVTIWSSYKYDDFNGSPQDRVYTAIWDPATNIVTARLVDNTDHDMFCPGISLDGNGQVVVTGGNSAQKTSFYDFPSGEWAAGPDMNVARGYQASAVCSDGRVFTIGGSWSGPSDILKNGEIYSPSANTWTMLPNAAVKPMLTNDPAGYYRADNHAWLFGWKNGTLFQGGPSTAMNWYYTNGNGNVKAAGKRQSDRGVDPDSMCGNAVMFDATKGKILTVGGSPAYEQSYATAHAHLITIGDPGTNPTVAFASNGMYYERTFHTTVVLPDGKVFITGGQSYAVPFSDSTPQLTPEMYDPDQDRFFEQSPNSIVRVYHSVSLLLPDGRIFNGGGGLCGDCFTNHFDAQIYTPQYLLKQNGQPAARPTINSVSATTLKVGATFTITTDTKVTAASLMRYGATTHTVNTDQRRIPLTLTSAGTKKYSMTLPGDPGILLPGYYMLFVLNSNGVPSVSKAVKVTLS